MNKTFLLNTDLRSARFLGADPAVRGHWVALQSYCSERETGGVVERARKYSAREWGVAMGAGGSLRAAERLVLAGFARWADDNLILAWYHTASEARYQDIRRRASRGGQVKAAKDRERRNQSESRDSGGLESSGGTAPATASATSHQREGADGLEEARPGVEGVAPSRHAEAGAGVVSVEEYWGGEASGAVVGLYDLSPEEAGEPLGPDEER
jgi:hypothetical protein